MNKLSLGILVATLALGIGLPVAQAENVNKSGQCIDCKGTAAKPNLKDEIEKLVPAMACPKTGRSPINEKPDGDCQKEFACNIMRSILDIPAGAYSNLTGAGIQLYDLLKDNAQKRAKQEPGCLSGRKSSCMAEAWIGFFKDLKWNLEGLWWLAKAPFTATKAAVVATGKGAGNLLGKTYVWTENTYAEKKTATGVAKEAWKNTKKAVSTTIDGVAAAGRFVRNLDGNKLLAYFAALGDWEQELAKDMWKSSKEVLKHHFGCVRWAGAPHASECVVPYEGLDCMDCSDVMNAVCGVATVAASEAKLVQLLFTKGGSKAVAMFKDKRLLNALKKSDKLRALAKGHEDAVKTAAGMAATRRATEIDGAAASAMLHVDPVAKVKKVPNASAKAIQRDFRRQLDELKADMPAHLDDARKEELAVSKVHDLKNARKMKDDEIVRAFDDAKAAKAQAEIDLFTVDTSYLKAEDAAKIEKDFAWSHKHLVDSLAKEDARFAELLKKNPSEAKKIVSHVIFQLKTNKKWTAEAINAEIAKVLRSCGY